MVVVTNRTGEDDQMCRTPGAQAFFAAAGSADKQLRLYPKLYHEILLEPEGTLVLRDMLDWLNNH